MINFSPVINFTMLVHNRPKLTKQALHSLKSAGWGDLSVTIFDDASEDETASFLEKWCFDNGVYLIREEKSVGTGIARNSVIAESEGEYGRGDFLYLSDNDVFFYPSWAEILRNCFRLVERFGYTAVGAYNHPFHQHEDSIEVYGAYSVKKIGALALQSMLMTWETWDKYGPFCSTPVGRVCMGEDVEFAWKLAADGKKLGVVNPPVVVNTGITNSFGEKIVGWELVRDQAPAGVILE